MTVELGPVIDLGGLPDEGPSADVVTQLTDAAATTGVFYVANHGIDVDLISAVWTATRSFFGQDIDDKRVIMRTRENARGYYDRELTKNARDLKEVLDLSEVPFPDLADDDPRNIHEVDGMNQWPSLFGFRSTVNAYITACNAVASFLLEGFCIGLGEDRHTLCSAFRPTHTSFLRMNHYPVNDVLDAGERSTVPALGDMALHHHTDAGALTVLLQDQVGGLQVEVGDRWVDVPPVQGTLVINTGDMMQVWSNDRFRAAVHRVLPRDTVERFSLPYFYNPSYETDYTPLPAAIGEGDHAHYGVMNWGRFRQARADGDYADFGDEVQIENFRID